MTVKELYKWAVENHMENFNLFVRGYDGGEEYPIKSLVENDTILVYEDDKEIIL